MNCRELSRNSKQFLAQMEQRERSVRDSVVESRSTRFRLLPGDFEGQPASAPADYERRQTLVKLPKASPHPNSRKYEGRDEQEKIVEIERSSFAELARGHRRGSAPHPADRHWPSRSGRAGRVRHSLP